MKLFDASVPCSVFKSKVENHEEIKAKLLCAIEDVGIHNIITLREKISNTDWHVSNEIPGFSNKKYIEIAMPLIEQHLEGLQNKTGLCSPVISKVWFQQYGQGDYHGWHVHGRCMFSNIYYVDLDKDAAQTTFRHFGQEFTIGVEEGDILTFPSFMQHCSKHNSSRYMKTVISFNADFQGIQDVKI